MKKRKIVPIFVLSAFLGIGTFSVTSCGNNTNVTTKYKVNYNTSSDFTIEGLKSEGYDEGEDVSFRVNVTNPEKEVDKVTVNTTKLTAVDGLYSFKMPGTDVTLIVTLKDKSSTTEGLALNLVTSGEIIVGSTFEIDVKFNNTSLDSGFSLSATPESSVEINGKTIKALVAGEVTLKATYTSENKNYEASLKVTINDASTVEGDTVAKIKNGDISVGDFVTLKGKITLTSGTSAYFADATGGIFIYNWSANDGDTALVDGSFKAGDFVEIHAKVALNTNGGGSIQLSSYENGGRIEEVYAKKLDTTISTISPISLTEEDYKNIDILDTGNVYTFDATYVSGEPVTTNAANIEFKIGNTSTILRTDGNSSKMYDVNIDKLVSDFEALDLTAGDKVTITTALSWYNGPQFSYFGDGTIITKDNSSVEATAISISALDNDLLIGESTKLSYTLTPSNATGTVTYSIVDGNEFIRLENDTIYGISAGTAHVVGKIGSLTSEPIEIRISESDNPTITLAATEKTINIGETFELKASVIGVKDYELVYETSDSNIASVSAGVVTGVAKGNATITVSLKDNPNSKATCNVTVNEVDYSIGQIEEEGQTYTVRGVVAATNTQSVTLHDGENGILIYFGKTYDGSYKIGDYLEVTGDVSIYNGLLQFGGSEATLEITKLDGNGPTLNEATQLTSEIVNSWKTKGEASPSELTTADVQLYKWRATCGMAGDYEILNLDGTDVNIEPAYILDSIELVEGKVYDIEAYFNGYSSKYSYASIIVTKATLIEETIDATSVTINAPTSTTMKINETMTLTYAVEPGNATTKPTWTSDNEAVAIVENGVVTALSEGTVNITVAFSETVKDTITLTVSGVYEPPVSEVIYSKVYEYTKNEQPSSNDYNRAATDLNDIFVDENYPLVTSAVATKGFIDGNGLMGVKLGSGSATGSITLTLNSSDVAISKVEVHAISWTNKKPSVIAYRGDAVTGEYQNFSTTAVETLTFDLTGQSGSTITIGNKSKDQAFIVTGIVIYS